MPADDPTVAAVLRRARVARIATASRRGRPSVNPLYFVAYRGRIWLGTPEWTLAARNVAADPRVSLLFAHEGTGDRRVVRITGRAVVRTDPKTLRAYNVRAALRYVLAPGAVANSLRHRRQLPLRRIYHDQSAERGGPAVIEVVPEQAEILVDPR